ncbi:MAG: hypothetical protein IT285_02760 [Bdellovibrionales bacterium]|nr:hypothetical protein [Bdellovibrionales bacterium]
MSSASRAPTVILTSKDDPFVDVKPYLNLPRSSAVTLHVEPHGGHMGYLAAEPTPLGTRHWGDYAIAEAAKALLRV